MKAKAIVLACAVVVASCSTVSEVAPNGDGNYTVGAHGLAGNGSAAAQQVEALKAAAAFCGKSGKRAIMTSVDRVDPFFGRPPSATVTFKCDN